MEACDPVVAQVYKKGSAAIEISNNTQLEQLLREPAQQHRLASTSERQPRLNR